MDPYIGEIRIFAGNFAPAHWAMCNGQLLSISQNTALFSILGTTYGGDGRSNFALPNLQARAPMHFGQGAGLSQRSLGEPGGEENVTLLLQQMPSHPHTFQAGSGGRGGNVNTPTNNALSGGAATDVIYSDQAASIHMNQSLLTLAGGSTPHNNMMPYLVLNFIIALVGVFPPRN